MKTYISSFCAPKVLSKLSFIGHSLGGLIVRAALQYLEEYKEKFYTYISMSSPHLGYIQSQNKLIDAGLWFIKNWR